MKKKICTILLLILILSFGCNKYEYSKDDEVIFNNKFKEIIVNNNKSSKKSENFYNIANQFIDFPYKAFTLEREGKEKVKVDLSGLDCYTLVETSLALLELNKNNKINSYLKNIEKLRYRKGKLKDYNSRLHYFIDWKYEQEKKGIIKDITKEIGGEKYDKEINFMSKNNKYYKKLKDNVNNIKITKKIEDEINKRQYYYINENNIKDIENKLNSGDIIGITTTIKGLDISHVGIIRRIENEVHMLHASSEYKKVMLTEKTLSEYILSNSKQNGIIVLRLNEKDVN